MNQNSTCCVTSRHDTTRHDMLFSPCILAQEEVGTWRDETRWDVSCLSDSTARHARHDKRDRRDSHVCSGASPHYGLGWTCPPHFFQKLIVKLMKVLRTKDYTLLYTRQHYCLFVVRNVGTSTARHARHVTSWVSCRDATSGIWAIIEQS